jgi:MFS family permease
MQSVIRKIYAYRILDDFMLIYPLYSVMFAQRGGLTIYQISILFIVWEVTSMAVEVPTGLLADRFSRRKLLALGQVIRGAGYVCWLLWPSFTGYLVGFIFWGVGGSFGSGTYQALVYDELASYKAQDSYAKITGRAESLALLIGLVATLLATPVFKLAGYPGVLIGSLAAVAAAAAAALMLPDRKPRESAGADSYIAIMREAAGEVRANHHLVRVIGFGVLLSTLYGVMDEYSSLYFVAAGVATIFVPIVATLVYLPATIAGFLAYKLEKLRTLVFMLLVIAAGLALVVSGRDLGGLGIAGFAGFLLFIKVSEIVYGAKLQHGIAGSARSTITSFSALLVGIADILAYLVYGYLTKIGGMPLALSVIGAGTAAVGLVMAAYTRGRLFVRFHER